MSIKERKLQAEIRQLRADLKFRTSERDVLVEINHTQRAEIKHLEHHIKDLRELREFDRIKLERLRGMTV